MSALTVPITETANRMLEELSQQTGKTTSEVVDQALAAYHRQVFFDQLNRGYAALRADPKTSADLAAEQKAWDATLMDGLDPAERWSEDGRCLTPESDEG